MLKEAVLRQEKLANQNKWHLRSTINILTNKTMMKAKLHPKQQKKSEVTSQPTS